MNKDPGKIIKMLSFPVRRPGRVYHLVVNILGSRKKCYICGKTFSHFKKYKRGSRDVSEFLRMMNCTGSDVENFGCMYCGSMDRERHLFMFFDELGIWELITGGSVLHFAPERSLGKKIKTVAGSYIMADLNPGSSEVRKIDVCRIPFSNNTFDFVICNHVLEHVTDYRRGISEIFRVLKPSGTAILQTPYSTLLTRHFCDENINTDELRSYFYGEADHLRLFSRDQLFSEFESYGFELLPVSSGSLFSPDISAYYGVNHEEELVRMKKP
jgi:SAM-dependent methyltransferase